MLSKIGAYVITFLVFAGIEFPFFPIMLPVAVALKRAKRLFPRAKWLFPFVVGLFDVVKIGTAALLASWLIHKIGQSPSWLMFLIPGYFMVRNDRMRISRVKTGRSNLKRSFQQTGEPESYDQRHDLWTEQAHLAGDVVGWILGTNLVLQSAKFF